MVLDFFFFSCCRCHHHHHHHCCSCLFHCLHYCGVILIVINSLAHPQPSFCFVFAFCLVMCFCCCFFSYLIFRYLHLAKICGDLHLESTTFFRTEPVVILFENYKQFESDVKTNILTIKRVLLKSTFSTCMLKPERDEFLMCCQPPWMTSCINLGLFLGVLSLELRF